MQADINFLIKRLLQLDAEVAAELYELAGNVVQLNVENTSAMFTFLILPDGIELLHEQAEKVHVRISGTAVALFAYMAASRSGQTSMSRDLEISGDINLAQRLTDILRKFEIDWEEQLSIVCGDTLARKSAQFFRGGLTVLKELHSKLELDVGEYIIFEKELVADEDELQEFCHAVDTLRNDVERLRQRVTKLDIQEKC